MSLCGALRLPFRFGIAGPLAQPRETLREVDFLKFAFGISRSVQLNQTQTPMIWAGIFWDLSAVFHRRERNGVVKEEKVRKKQWSKPTSFRGQKCHREKGMKGGLFPKSVLRRRRFQKSAKQSLSFLRRPFSYGEWNLMDAAFLLICQKRRSIDKSHDEWVTVPTLQSVGGRNAGSSVPKACGRLL